MYEFPEDYAVGQKVWFHGLKAKVIGENFPEHVSESFFRLWAVPISIKNGNGITLAHVDDLTPRSKKK